MTAEAFDRDDRTGPSPGARHEVLVVRAWVVRDTGLAPAPPRHRRLPGALRHHRGEGAAWPDRVELRVRGDHLEVPGQGRWPLAEVTVEVLQPGPPVVLSLTAPGTRQLLGAPGDHVTAALVERLTGRQG